MLSVNEKRQKLNIMGSTLKSKLVFFAERVLVQEKAKRDETV